MLLYGISEGKRPRKNIVNLKTQKVCKTLEMVALSPLFTLVEKQRLSNLGVFLPDFFLSRVFLTLKKLGNICLT